MGAISSLISAGHVSERTLETVSNNIANANTTGYKQDQLSFREVLSTAERITPQSEEEKFLSHEYLDMYVGMDKSSVKVDSVGKNFTQGPLNVTNNKLDLAIQNEGFFSVMTPQGERYTRAGSFTLNKSGELVNNIGDQVLGHKGPIKVQGKDINIDENGRIYVDEKFIDTLKTAKFEHPQALQKLGDSYFAPVSNQNKAIYSKEIKVAQGALEKSNVNSVKEMVNMISANRSYESIMKAMGNVDKMDESAISLSRIT